ncbi:uncharacterized protein LOC135103261 [Scylla paramamosain]|uniref:uncharacterized protein LOC135103261 n=1 Tax=Scylla paramamosain TaxID=85552 RepID=UPI003082AA5F
MVEKLNTEDLICEIEKLPALWDPSCEGYANKIEKQNCWNAIMTPPHHVITYSHHVTTTYPHHHTMSPPPTHTLSPPPTHTNTPRYHPHLVTTIHPRHHTMSSATPCHHHPPTPPHHVTTHTIV